MALYSVNWYTHKPGVDQWADAHNAPAARRAARAIGRKIFPGQPLALLRLINQLDALEGFAPSKVPGMVKTFNLTVEHLGEMRINIYRTNRKGHII